MLASLGLISSYSAALSIPIIDDQPQATETCPISNTDHTETSSWFSGSSIGVRNYACVIDDVNITWSVSIPEACETVSCGLIIDIHGATMSAAQENNGTKMREFGWQAMDRGAITPYIVAQPNLTDLFDEAGGVDPGSVAGGAYDNELSGIEYFIGEATSAFGIDTTRIHMYGFSRGAATTSRFYCNAAYNSVFASYGVGGGGVGCALDKPLLMLSGIFDPGKTALNDAREAEMNAKPGATTVTIAEDSNWQVPTFFGKGKQVHTRHVAGGYVFDSIKHSGVFIPTAGHCHPVTSVSRWLACNATFDTGQKLIDFFIANPQ